MQFSWGAKLVISSRNNTKKPMSTIYVIMCNHPPTKAMGSLTKNVDSQPTLVGPDLVRKEDPLGLENKRSASPSETDGPQQKKHRVEEQPPAEREKEEASSNKTPLGQGNASYGDQDVLSGRGGGTNLHPGNRHYRDLILSHRQTYDIASKSKKPNVSRNIVQMVRDRGGKFLRKEKDDLYYDIGDEAAREKTSQALRHRTFEMRNKEDSRKQKLLKAKEEVRNKRGIWSLAIVGMTRLTRYTSSLYRLLSLLTTSPPRRMSSSVQWRLQSPSTPTYPPAKAQINYSKDRSTRIPSLDSIN
jgi:hypothetical protein